MFTKSLKQRVKKKKTNSISEIQEIESCNSAPKIRFSNGTEDPYARAIMVLASGCD